MVNGEELKRIRMLRGISQSQLANTLGMRNREIIAYESEDKNMSEELYQKWLTALYDDATQNASRKKVITCADATKAKKTTRKRTTKQTNDAK